jgi:hypothetical protein
MYQQDQQQQHHHHHQFPKSHSIDNLPREMYQQKKPVSYSNSNLWNQGPSSDLSSQQHQQQHDTLDMSLNLHKKLQRQLSLLNPYDPRLYPMQRYHNAPPQQQQQQQQTSHNMGPNSEHFQLSSPPSHKPLSASHSLTGPAGGQNQTTHSIYEHQVKIFSLLLLLQMF